MQYTPHFSNALELVAHAKTHLNGKKELDRKLVILHLSHAIEFILKDLLLINNISISDKNPDKTLTLLGSIKKLEENKIKINHQHGVELLIKQRNYLQHTYGSTNQEMIEYYSRSTDEFLSEIFKKYYKLDYVETINRQCENEDAVLHGYSQLDKNSELDRFRVLSKIHSLSAYLATWNYIERLTVNFIVKSTYINNSKYLSNISIKKSLNAIDVILPDSLEKNINNIYELRRKVEDGNKVSEEEVECLILITSEYENFINSIKTSNIKDSIDSFNKEMREVKKEIKGLTIGEIIASHEKESSELFDKIKNIKVEDVLSLYEKNNPLFLLKLIEETGISVDIENLINSEKSNK